MSVSEDIQPVERYLFLLLFAPDTTGKYSQPVKGDTWLQKEMFLLSKTDRELADEAEFEAYAMGSYSDTIAEIQDEFYISGFAERTDDGVRLTLDGRKQAEKMWDNSTESERRTVSAVKSWLNDLPFYELLAIIYTHYPESAAKSEVKDQVETRRPDLAVSLLKKGKVSLEMARRITGLTQAQFEGLLAVRGVTMAEVESAEAALDSRLLNDLYRSAEDSRDGRFVPWEKMNRDA